MVALGETITVINRSGKVVSSVSRREEIDFNTRNGANESRRVSTL